MKIGRVCHVDVSWINPLGIVQQKTELKLDAGSTVTTQKLNLETPIMPGKWAVQITSSNTLFVEKQFVVFPVMFDKEGEPLAEPPLLNAKRITETMNKAQMDVKKHMEWRIDVLKKDMQLEEWLDKLVNEYWSLKSTCSYSSSSYSKKTVCRTLPSCATSSWSSYYPDVKSELGPINSQGRIR